MRNRTLLVDASFLLKRSFNGVKDAYTNKFGHIGGLYGFFTMTRKLIKDHMINKVILVWDGENSGIARYDIDNKYKSNRKSKKWFDKIELSEYEIRRENDKEQSLLKQKKRIQQYAEELFIRQIEVDEIEADDIISSYCIDKHKKENIIIYTNDRDFSQLLRLDITIMFANIAQPITKSNYMMYHEHHHSNALTIKIICGDDGDCIEGIQGIKEKTLIKHFPELKFKTMTVRDICKRAQQINEERKANKQKPLKVLTNLLNGVDRLKKNYLLINLYEPMLNEEAVESLEQLEMPLSPENRGSKLLYKLMLEDDFLKIYGSTFVNYVEPFYSVIMNEKSILKEYYRKRGKSI